MASGVDGVVVGAGDRTSSALLGIEKVRVRRNIVVAAVTACCVLALICATGVALTKARTTSQRTQQSSPTTTVSFVATPTSGTAPLTVQFTDTSAGTPTAWKWSFGDGTTATGRSPSHVYATAGKFAVTLAVTSATGTTSLTKQGNITVNSPVQSGWTTIVDDQFNTPGIPSHWLLYSGSYAGDTSSCTAPSQVQVPGDGYLHMKMEYHASGICGRGWYTGGMQIAKEYSGVDQAITLRWRVVPSADPDVVRSTRVIPMRWVDDPNYEWYQGEADYCEGSAFGGCYAYLHYGPNSQQVVHGYQVDLTQWHTFRIEQRNHQVSIFIDNMTKPVWVYKGNATTVPNAVMRTVLQQSCSLTAGCPPASYAGDVEDIQIDWITIQNATSANTDTQSQTSIVAQGQATTMPVMKPVASSLQAAKDDAFTLAMMPSMSNMFTVEPRRRLLATPLTNI